MSGLCKLVLQSDLVKRRSMTHYVFTLTCAPIYQRPILYSTRTLLPKKNIWLSLRRLRKLLSYKDYLLFWLQIRTLKGVTYVMLRPNTFIFNIISFEKFLKRATSWQICLILNKSSRYAQKGCQWSQVVAFQKHNPCFFLLKMPEGCKVLKWKFSIRSFTRTRTGLIPLRWRICRKSYRCNPYGQSGFVHGGGACMFWLSQILGKLKLKWRIVRCVQHGMGWECQVFLLLIIMIENVGNPFRSSFLFNFAIWNIISPFLKLRSPS